MLTHLDLFSGIGGFALAAEWAGFRTIGFVEIDGYCQKVLRKHWPNMPIVEDIRDVKRIKEIVAHTDRSSKSVLSKYEEERQGQLVRRRTSGRQQFPITLITGGFPCQPFSVAGKRAGKADNRYLWPEMLHIVEEVRPHWVLGENVAGIIRMELDNCLSDLERIGYSTQAFVIPACAINAPHRRDRVWIVANSISRESGSKSQWSVSRTQNKKWGSPEEGRKIICPRPQVSLSSQSRQTSDTVANTKSRKSRQPPKSEGGEDTSRGSKEITMAHATNRVTQSRGSQCDVGGFQGQILPESWDPDYWAVEPELGRVAHGIPNRVDRLRCLGNAIVPQVVYQILKVIAEIES